MIDALFDLPSAEARRIAALCDKTQRVRLTDRSEDLPWSEIDAEILAQIAKLPAR